MKFNYIVYRMVIESKEEDREARNVAIAGFNKLKRAKDYARQVDFMSSGVTFIDGIEEGKLWFNSLTGSGDRFVEINSDQDYSEVTVYDCRKDEDVSLREWIIETGWRSPRE